MELLAASSLRSKGLGCFSFCGGAPPPLAKPRRRLEEAQRSPLEVATTSPEDSDSHNTTCPSSASFSPREKESPEDPQRVRRRRRRITSPRTQAWIHPAQSSRPPSAVPEKKSFSLAKNASGRTSPDGSPDGGATVSLAREEASSLEDDDDGAAPEAEPKTQQQKCSQNVYSSNALSSSSKQHHQHHRKKKGIMKRFSSEILTFGLANDEAGQAKLVLKGPLLPRSASMCSLSSSDETDFDERESVSPAKTRVVFDLQRNREYPILAVSDMTWRARRECYWQPEEYAQMSQSRMWLERAVLRTGGRVRIEGESRRGLGLVCEPETRIARASKIQSTQRAILRMHAEGASASRLARFAADTSSWATRNALVCAQKDLVAATEPDASEVLTSASSSAHHRQNHYNVRTPQAPPRAPSRPSASAVVEKATVPPEQQQQEIQPPPKTPEPPTEEDDALEDEDYSPALALEDDDDDDDEAQTLPGEEEDQQQQQHVLQPEEKEKTTRSSFSVVTVPAAAAAEDEEPTTRSSVSSTSSSETNGYDHHRGFAGLRAVDVPCIDAAAMHRIDSNTAETDGLASLIRNDSLGNLRDYQGGGGGNTDTLAAFAAARARRRISDGGGFRPSDFSGSPNVSAVSA